MKVLLISLLWILILSCLKEVYGETEIVLSRSKRNHEPFDEEKSTDCTKILLSTEKKDVEVFSTTENIDQDIKREVKSITKDVPLKKILKRRKNKKGNDKKLDSFAPPKSEEETPINDEICISNTDKKQDESISNKDLVNSDKNENEETSKSEEVEQQSNNNETSQINDQYDAIMNILKPNQNVQNAIIQDSVSFDEPKVETNSDEINDIQEILSDETGTETTSEEEKSTETVETTKNCESNKKLLLAKKIDGICNDSNLIEAVKEVKNAAIIQDKDSPNDTKKKDLTTEKLGKTTNKKFRKRRRNNDLTQSIEPQHTKEPIKEVSSDKLPENKFDFSSLCKIPMQSNEEKDLKSNICTSKETSENKKNSESLDSQKQGPALSYEQENLQHYIRRCYVYPPLPKSSVFNNFVSDYQSPLQSNSMDFVSTVYPQNNNNFCYNAPSNGYVDEYQVQDATGHKVAYTKFVDNDRIHNNVLNTYPNANNNIWRSSNTFQQYPYAQIYNEFNKNNNGKCIQYKKTTNIPNLNGYKINENMNQNVYHEMSNSYIPTYNKYNDANKLNLNPAVKLTYLNNCNQYQTKDNVNQKYNLNIKSTNSYDESKIKSNYNENFFHGTNNLSAKKVHNSNNNYAKSDLRKIKPPNDYTANENLDKIGQDLRNENFQSVEEEIWNTWGNRKLIISDCNQNRINSM